MAAINTKVKKAVIPVAGLGTRMLPATKAIPKEMLPLVDKPLIQYAVEEAIDAGIERIIFITGRTKKALEDHFDINVELNQQLESAGKTDLLYDMKRISEMVDIIYVRQKYMLGLGNAICCVQDIVKNEPFAVILPDDINIDALIKRCDDSISEVIIATNPTVEGETTALYLSKLLEKKNIHATRIAHGLPMGAHLDYADEMTLIKAMENRKKIG